MVLVERDGIARCMPVVNVTGRSLKTEIAVTVAKSATVVGNRWKTRNWRRWLVSISQRNH